MYLRWYSQRPSFYDAHRTFYDANSDVLALHVAHCTVNIVYLHDNLKVGEYDHHVVVLRSLIIMHHIVDSCPWVQWEPHRCPPMLL